MKKNILSVCCFLLMAMISYSQVKENNLEISLGPSFPVGNYASKNLQSDKSGFAKTGQQINVSYTYKLTKKFGLVASLYAQRNPLSADALNRSFSSQNLVTSVIWTGTTTTTGPPIPTPQNPPAVYYKNWDFEKHAWLSASLLFGSEAELPLNKTQDFSFIARAMIGITGVKSPELNGKSITDTAAASVTQTSKSALGFVYQLRTGVKYKVSKKIGLLLSVDYIATNELTFKKVKSVITTANISGNGLPNGSQSMRTGNAKQVLQSINLNAGIVFSL